jgi:hypothetical protein
MSATLIALGVLALLAGVALFVVDARRRSLRGRVRREWAGRHSARYTAVDPVLTGQWHHGVFSRGGAGRAMELVNGEPDGNRLYLFDLEQASSVACTVVALRRPTISDTTLELRMGSSTAATGSEASQKIEQVTSEAGMDLLGHVGTRYAFTDDLEAARRAVDERLVLLADSAGEDISVLWAEGAWALAAVNATAGPQRWDEIAALLGRFADLVRLLPPPPR